MAALTVLVLADRGAIDLDAPVSSYWPEFRRDDVLVRHLLGHTSGYAGWTETLDFAGLMDLERSEQMLAEQEPWWEPGSASGYHMIAYGHLLDGLVRGATGTPLADQFRTLVAEPLGADFHLGVPGDVLPRCADLVAPTESGIDYSNLPEGNFLVPAVVNPLLDVETGCNSDVSDDVGGNWYFRNPNGRSAVYESLHIDTSKTRLQFEDFPVPDEWPDFPSHRLMHDYFRAYVDEFDLRDGITFRTGVDRAARNDDGGWDVTLSTGETRSYTDLVVANGHHWKPSLPDYPGSLRRRADPQPRVRVAVRAGRDPRQAGGRGRAWATRRWTSPASCRPPWMAETLYVSARRGVWVLPKYRNGQPADKVMAPPDIPKDVALVASRELIRGLVGNMSDYGLPEPDHEPLSAHPSVSADFLTKAGSGDIHMLPAISSLDGTTVTSSTDRRSRPT